ncbi:gamma-glutamyl-gamma-aminobutyrate hydrolase family protein [Paenibacillus aestuarii]|uniref:Gamma-glutamyl-gamma-aminobutyrate hydrolase family protein n=1 Tax=Paenibacillus aestuarii TaxID=516965 RepID=A0ABW0KB18_9BACL|nr:gamma-glutamyl-gamma-aminobutyrate hydrolase family protein [Paenibacillus aestuarii]
MKKPIIGISCSFSPNGQIGVVSHLGAPSQEWQLLADDYIQAIEKAGGIPVILPVVENPETILPILAKLDGILFTGGNDVSPLCFNEIPSSAVGEVSVKRDRTDLALIKSALENYQMPILGICRGCQVLNVALGGTLHQDLTKDGVTKNEHFLLSYPIEHISQKVNLETNSRLAKIFASNSIGINSFHHQAVKNLGKNLVVAARAEDDVIEAIEIPGERFIVGVQWHPEMMQKNKVNHSVLFESFINECSLER